MQSLPLFQEAPLDQEETCALVALSMVPTVGPGKVRALLARFGSARAALAANERALSVVDGVGPQTAAMIAAFDAQGAVDDQFERASKVGARLITLFDPDFPQLLRQIYDPPILLWIRGSLEPRDANAIAVVGTRRSTEYGRRVAHQFAFDLARSGFTIVSGLAYGIDAVAHRAAVEAAGRTVAVLGSGVDVVYPAKHRSLVEQIEDGKGAVISEFPLGMRPDAPHFPRRNRLIAGLSLGTLVAEARETGGALLTAWMATEQNRAVYAIPAPVIGEAGPGTNQLIQKGYAALVTSAAEIIRELGLQIGDAQIEKPKAHMERPAPPSLTGPEKGLFEVLRDDPLPLDEICERAGLDASNALVYLLSLEFKGVVRQMAGKQFYRA